MRTEICFCNNCGEEYICQLSGKWCLDTPREYNDHEYCPTCKKAIIDALSTIPKKTDIRYVDTDDFTIDELLKIYQTKTLLSPNNAVRVYASTLGNTTKSVEFNGYEYIFTYEVDTFEKVSIRKKVRWDIIKNIEYKK